MARVLSFLIRYFSNYYTLHCSGLAAQAAPLDPRLFSTNVYVFLFVLNVLVELFLEKERTVFILFKYLLQLTLHMLYILVDGDFLNSALLI